jgi:PKD repeat protein
MRKLELIISLALVAFVSGCTTKETSAPPLTGPSEFALRIALQSIPDSILQDGASQAAIEVQATGPDGRAVRALALRIETELNGLRQDYGTLSTRTAVTGEDGRARIVYTAPPRPAESTGDIVVVSFVVTPITNDFQGVEPRRVDLRLVPPGVILPPNTAPVAAFVFSPTTVLPLQDVVFDASSSIDPDIRDAAGNPRPCGATCTYRWDFGDGNTASGIFARHQYRSLGTYQVRLTVTDPRGASGIVAQSVSVGAAAPPTASFTFSPTAPAPGQIIFFNAEASRPAAGRQLVSYSWDFGSGRTGTGVTTSKGYDTAGTYIVTLTVEDDAGALATTSQSVAVGEAVAPPSGLTPTAVFTFSPTTPGVNQTIFFNGSGSTTPVGTTVTSYAWDFGNGTLGSGATPTNAFSAPGTYVVRLTVTNSAGQTGTSTQNVTVAAGTP